MGSFLALGTARYPRHEAAPAGGRIVGEGLVRIQVLGTGGSRNKELLANVRVALRELGLAAAVESVESIHRIVQLGVMSMPALAVDGQIESSGRILSAEEIKELLRATMRAQKDH